MLQTKAKDEGCQIQVNWQDQDSSEKSFRSVYGPETSARVMKCGGHVGRSHANVLKDMKAKNEFDTGYISKHEKTFPEVRKVVCLCVVAKARDTLLPVGAFEMHLSSQRGEICFVPSPSVGTVQTSLHSG